MATAADLLADLDARIAPTAPIDEATKIRYLNHGMAAMWPKIYETSVDSSIFLESGEYEYAIQSGVGDYGMITRIDVESAVGSNRWMPLDDVELLPTQTGKALVLNYRPSYDGARIRVISANRITPFASSASTYGGPPGTEEIPVWYALGLVLSRGVEPRTDYKRYSTTVAANGVDLEEMIVTAQFAFAQFELLLDRAAMPLPSRVG